MAQNDINIIEYAKNQRKSFDELRLNSIDSLIFSQLSYLKFENLDKNLTLQFSTMLSPILISKLVSPLPDYENNANLLISLCNNPRFSEVKIENIQTVLEDESQFFAMTFALPTGDKYISFRGTDNSLAGWKEDFNMSFMKEIPSQKLSVFYVNEAFIYDEGRFYIGGHSKGGNLAIYAAANCLDTIKSKILTVFCHDGPGFEKDVITYDKYKMVADKIEKTVPQSSMIGMVLNNFIPYTIIKSSGLGGILQHNPFTWIIKPDYSDFVPIKSISQTATMRNEAISAWLNSLNIEERENFFDSLFEILGSTDAQYFSDIAQNWQISLPLMYNKLKNTDDETVVFIKKTLKLLADNSTKMMFGKKGNKNEQISKDT